MTTTITVKKLHPLAKIPEYGRKGDAAFDFFSCEDVTLLSGKRAVIHTGIALEFPEDFCLIIKDRSGLSFTHGLTVLGGVFDSNYRGEYKILLLNTSEISYDVKKGDKIAQGILFQRPLVSFIEKDELSDSNRSSSGFGSSGR